MVRHNNILPNVHFRKWWQRYVKTWFDQPGQKKARQKVRKLKEKKCGIRPYEALRPTVHPPTQRYNLRLRMGRGFTLSELKEAKISPKVASTVGITVDKRRKNRSKETLKRNASRLEDYLKRLVVFPKKGVPKKGLGGLPDDTRNGAISKAELKVQRRFPIVKRKLKIRNTIVTPAMNKNKVFKTIRKARCQAKKIGRSKVDLKLVQ